MALSADGQTQIRWRRNNDGTITLKLTSGAVAIIACIDGLTAMLLGLSFDQPDPAKQVAA